LGKPFVLQIISNFEAIFPYPELSLNININTNPLNKPANEDF